MEPALRSGMADTTSIPELDTPRKPQPELKRPAKPEPEIKPTPRNEKEVFDKDDQADSGPDKDHPFTREEATAATRDEDTTDAHIGAREDQVSDTRAPSGDAFKDEPKQG
jgi:hypothetical protein